MLVITDLHTNLNKTDKTNMFQFGGFASPCIASTTDRQSGSQADWLTTVWLACLYASTPGMVLHIHTHFR